MRNTFYDKKTIILLAATKEYFAMYGAELQAAVNRTPFIKDQCAGIFIWDKLPKVEKMTFMYRIEFVI